MRDLENGYANFSRFENAVFYTSPTVGGWHVHAAAEAERDPLDVRRPAGVSFNHAQGNVLGHLALERNSNDDRIGVVSLSWQSGKLRLMASTARHLPRIGLYADVYRERAIADANGAALGIMHTF